MKTKKIKIKLIEYSNKPLAYLIKLYISKVIVHLILYLWGFTLFTFPH